jgi:hypothetical membrane protein
MKNKNIKELKLNKKKDQSITKSGIKFILLGIFLLILGFYLLSKTDPMGKNFPSLISPFIIISGYILIAIGIIFPEHKKFGGN